MWMRRSRARALAFGVLVAFAVGGCGSSSSSTTGLDSRGSAGSSRSPLTVAVLQAFTGPNASFGQTFLGACQAAVNVVNSAGGVLGHPLNCRAFDTKGDPTDAVPVATRMVASASGLVAIVGPGPEAPATVPITSEGKIPDFVTTGDPQFDHNKDPWFFRITPSDNTQGYALGDFAAANGYTHVASVFTADTGAQTSVGPFKSEFKHKGGAIVADLTIQPGALSYRTEVERVLSAHPQAIVTEMDARTAATFMQEMVQLAGGTLPPFISTQRSIITEWATAVSKAIGGPTLQRTVNAIAPYTTLSGPGWDFAKPKLLATLHEYAEASSPFVLAVYDGIIIAALAMNEAKSTDTTAFRPFITKITTASSGASVVSNYADGVAALKAGKTIQYIGGSGPLPFDQYQNVKGAYAVYKYDPKTNTFNPGKVITVG